jgi:hypothetical protein
MRARVSQPGSIDAIADLLTNHIKTGTLHTRGPVNVAVSTKDKSALNWSFTDEDRQEWSGEAKTEPAPDGEGEFVVTLRLTRAAQTAKT